MSKFPKIYLPDEADEGYKYAEIQILASEYASIGADIQNGELTVWSQGGRAENTPITPKKLRKFARALLALADQVDPPATVVLTDKDGQEWFEITPGAWTWGHGRKGEEGRKRARTDVERGDTDEFTNQTRAQLDNHEFAPFTAARPA